MSVAVDGFVDYLGCARVALTHATFQFTRNDKEKSWLIEGKKKEKCNTVTFTYHSKDL